MSEAIRRHYTRLKKNRSKLPDVLFVDGGKGQLSRTLLVLDQIGLKNLNVVAIAKNKSRKSGSEKLFMPNISKPLILPYDSLAKLLIQNIRDEAHRFAISGHRLKRGKKIKQSQLERIPGLGPKRRRDLLREFGGLEGIMKAGISDLSKVQGISKLMSERVYNNLHDYQ
jgi:excinuclease ABC subunit C